MKKEENTTNSRNEKQLLINKIYAHLVGKQILNSKKEMAQLIGYNDKNFISALNGNERYLTDGLFSKIYKKYPETKNIKLTDDLETTDHIHEVQKEITNHIDNDLHQLVSEIKLLRKELEEEKQQNRDQAKAIIDFIEKERIAVSDLILDLKNTLVTKKENK